MTTATTNSTSGKQPDKKLYYDPYDFEIDNDPYPVWKRLRDEQPLYYNEKYDFFALSRYEDVVRASKDWRTYSSAKGTLLELIKSGWQVPPGMLIFEDPPAHDIHRGLVSSLFSPKAMSGLETKVREFCARALDPLVGTGGFDFIEHLGAQMPMRVIGMMLGIPEQDQEALRDKIDEGLRLSEGAPPPEGIHERVAEGQTGAFAEYIDWRAEHPSDDVMTELLQAEFEDTDGKRRKLTRDEVLSFVNLIAAAGNETTTRLIGWTGKVLAEHPDQRRELAADLSLVPRAIEELLRFEPPSPVNARYVTTDTEHHGRTVKQGSAILLLVGSANRDERKFDKADRFDIHRPVGQHITFGYGVHFCLGAALARLEGRVALEEVLKRFPEWEVDWDNAVRAHTSTVRGWERLPVKTPR
ncbi:MAG: cytochrome P450 [Myxococcales bacterium]|nr:cytochrome P450 [Myxococcales bacterium]MDD9967300.1 cytochrome P450 [Myxococcales bacterium]